MKVAMVPVLKRYTSFEAAAKADREYYASLTPEQRMQILFELIAMERGKLDDASEGMARVYRIVKLASS